MKRGLIQNEIARLQRVKVFTPNVHAQWMEEENERSFIEWCKKDEAYPLMADTLEHPKVSPFKSLTAFLVAAIP